MTGLARSPFVLTEHISSSTNNVQVCVGGAQWAINDAPLQLNPKKCHKHAI